VRLREEMRTVLEHCRKNRWEQVLRALKREPELALRQVMMQNRVATTVLHQAVTSRGDVKQRDRVCRQILTATPQAAAMKNGFGSFPVHVVAQRNTKMDVETKQRLLSDLIDAYPPALVEPGGKGKRTPLHVLFTGTCPLPE